MSFCSSDNSSGRWCHYHLNIRQTQMAKKDNGKSLVRTTDCLKRSHKDASVFSRFDEAPQPIYRTIELSVVESQPRLFQTHCMLPQAGRQAGFPLFLNNIISCSIGKFYSNFENLHNPQVERHSRRTCTHELVLPEQTCSLVYLSTCPMARLSFCTWNKGSIWSFLSLVSMRPNPAIYNHKTLHKALNEMKRWMSV